MNKIRVAFPCLGFEAGWNGGINYLYNLLKAINLCSDTKIEPVLLASKKDAGLARARLGDIEIVETCLLSGYSLPRIIAKTGEKVLGRNLLLERLLIEHGIDLLSHGQSLGRQSPVASLCWIPDFQHQRLPHYFSNKELCARDKSFRRAIRNSTLVLVSSFSARRDLELFEPLEMHRSRVLRFVVPQKEQQDVVSVDKLESRYGFSGPYFYLPNQFWMHKNHVLVVEALAQLEKRGIEALVVCTGKPHDYRNPRYFARLQDSVKRLGQSQRFLILGEVPYEDVFSLMIHSISVINPSLFEGWSTTVEEAKTLGKPILLSDIPVHREQAPIDGIYFSPESETELADAMEKVISCLPGLCPEPVEQGLQQDLVEPWFIRYAMSFEEIAVEAVELNKSGFSRRTNDPLE